ncbi:MAG: HK97 family phage prohead protease [Armatimonadia bacterium]|nr:HK97 family phage prohead protease [Armatimonadia bacterium]
MMTMERRTILTNDPVTVTRADGDDGPTRISGLAAVYYREDDPGTEFQLWPGVVERIMPGAFDGAIADDDVRGLFNHDASQVLGRTSAGTMRLDSEKKGLTYDIDAPDTQLGRDLMTSIERGDVSGSSFAFRVTEEKWIDDEDNDREIREIHAVQLFDVGPVTFPAYESTTAGVRLVAYRSASDADEAATSLEAWRERKRAAAGRQRRARKIESDLKLS